MTSAAIALTDLDGAAFFFGFAGAGLDPPARRRFTSARTFADLAALTPSDLRPAAWPWPWFPRLPSAAIALTDLDGAAFSFGYAGAGLAPPARRPFTSARTFAYVAALTPSDLRRAACPLP